MPSWMTAFVSKHPNMHCSATRGKVSLQHPISRGLLPPRRGADCARAEIVRVFVFACICMCVSPSMSAHARAHTHMFVDTDLLTTLPLWFIFKQTAQPSPLPHLQLSPSFSTPPSLSVSLMLTTNPSIFQIPSLSQSNAPISPSTYFTPPSISPCFHLSIPPSAFTSRGVDNFLNLTEVERFHI